MLKHVQPTLLMLLSSVLSATLASAKPAEVVREQITLRGTVENVDDTVRTVRIRGDRGNVVTRSWIALERRGRPLEDRVVSAARALKSFRLTDDCSLAGRKGPRYILRRAAFQVRPDR